MVLEGIPPYNISWFSCNFDPLRLLIVFYIENYLYYGIFTN